MGGTYSVALAINNAGQVVGASTTTSDIDVHATLWNGSTAIDLGTLGGSFSYAYAINNSGQIVGVSTTIGNTFFHATLWTGDTLIDLNSLLDVGTINAGWQLADAHGINDNGWIVGNAYNNLTGQAHAFLLSPGVAAPVPEPATYTMMLAGLCLLSFSARRRKQLAAA